MMDESSRVNGAVLRSRRIELDLSRRLVAQRAKMSESTIYKWETGRQVFVRSKELARVEAVLQLRSGAAVIGGPQQDRPPTVRVSLGTVEASATEDAAGHTQPLARASGQEEVAQGLSGRRYGYPGSPGATEMRRYMAWAAHGLCDSSVVAAVVEHLERPSPETAAIIELPGALASTFHLRRSFTFRANASQAFRDALEAIVFHATSHASRAGEEAADAVRLLFEPRRHLDVDKILYSDLDHPALTHLIETIWPRGQTRRLRLAEALLGNSEYPRQEVINRYVAELSSARFSAVLIPHVVWLNGAVLDVCGIAAAVRQCDPLVTTIVDGAQAFGHIRIDIEDCERENSNIDFYIGCGHKWLGGPEAMGFVRVGSRFAVHCAECSQFLSSSDQLSDAGATRLEFMGQQIGTNHRGVARGLLQAIRTRALDEAHYQQLRRTGEKVRDLIDACSLLTRLGPPEGFGSAIVAFVTGSDDETRKLRSRLDEHGFSCSMYQFPRDFNLDGRKFFLRLSPGSHVSEQDIGMLANILNEAQG